MKYLTVNLQTGTPLELSFLVFAGAIRSIRQGALEATKAKPPANTGTCVERIFKGIKGSLINLSPTQLTLRNLPRDQGLKIIPKMSRRLSTRFFL